MNIDKSSERIARREKALRLAIEAIAAYTREGGLPSDFEKPLIKAAEAIESYLSSGESPSS